MITKFNLYLENNDEIKMFYPTPKEDEFLFKDTDASNPYNGYILSEITTRHYSEHYVYFDLVFNIPYDENWDESPIEQQIEGYVEMDEWWEDNIKYYDIDTQYETFIEWMDDIVIKEIKNFLKNQKVREFNL